MQIAMRRTAAIALAALFFAVAVTPGSAAGGREDVFEWGGLCFFPQKAPGENGRLHPTVLVIAQVAPATRVKLTFRDPVTLGLDLPHRRTKAATRTGFGGWQARFRVGHAQFRHLREGRIGMDTVGADVHVRWRGYEYERYASGRACRP